MTWELLILEKEPPIISRWPQKCRADWDISFSDGVTYRCDSNTYIENDGIDKNDAEIQVDCIDFVGEYNTPVKQGESWPNCTETVVCGQPPEPPINGTRTRSI